MSKAKIAVVNFETSGDKPANQEKMIDFITQAAEQGCDLIVFPEESLTGIGERGFAVASAEDKQFGTRARGRVDPDVRGFGT